MDVKEAVSRAKSWVVDVLGPEGISNVGLEEVDFDEDTGEWEITIGFSRPWNTTKNAFTAISGEPAVRRAYRVITVAEPNGTVKSMKRKSLED